MFHVCFLHMEHKDFSLEFTMYCFLFVYLLDQLTVVFVVPNVLPTEKLQADVVLMSACWASCKAAWTLKFVNVIT